MSASHGCFMVRRLPGLVTASLVLAVSVSVYGQAPVTPPGAGTESDPYLISQLGHLVWMGNTAATSSGKYYSLTADIDASATAGWNDVGTDTTVLEGFRPIGTYSSPDTTSFRGIFEGNGHIISGLVVNRPATDYVGLFGSVASTAQVRNLGLVGGAVTGYVAVGGLVGIFNGGRASRCYATSAVTGSVAVGGLVGGILSGAVLDCYATGPVTGSEAVGGLVGNTDFSRISNCYATGAVTGSSYVSGLIGWTTSHGTESNSYWDMQTSGQSTPSGGTGKTTAEMKQQATFAGWDFTSVWGIVEGTSYPYLRFSPPPFTLTVKVSGPGNVTVYPPSADGTYAPGTVVTLTAIPSGLTDALVRWTGAAPSESPTVTVVMDIHRSVTCVLGPRIEINTLADLARIGNDPAYPLADVLYDLTADIDASATAGWNDTGTGTDVLEGFKPIGTYSSSSPDTTSFRAIFDGNGHTISGLVVNRPVTDYVGLFGCVGIGGQVRNLGMAGGAVTGNDDVGGLVGSNKAGTVSNCYATGAVTASSSVGGLAGANSGGTISNCYATGAVTGSGSAGGLLGYNFYGTVSDCYATGAVMGGSRPGGLVGYNSYGTVSNSYWDTQTSGQSTSDGGTGKTTAEMKQQATFVGWDFADLWGITENVTYPFLRLSPADFDGDRDVDLADFAIFQGCFNGPNRPIAQGCGQADLDDDADVDLADFSQFQGCVNGPNRPPQCP